MEDSYVEDLKELNKVVSLLSESDGAAMVKTGKYACVGEDNLKNAVKDIGGSMIGNDSFRHGNETFKAVASGPDNYIMKDISSSIEKTSSTGQTEMSKYGA